MARYTHIDRAGIVGVVGPTEVHADQKIGDKPWGLWYSVDEHWEQWCASEMPEWLNARRFAVTFGAENILRLDDPLAVLVFDERYGCEENLGGMGRSFWYHRIDWPRVCSEYDGIEIAPYQWSLRMDERVRWYYGWDCASGCVWRPRGMTLEPIGPYVAERTEAA